MRAMNPKGFTLIELVVALALGAVVAAAMLQILVGTQRATQAGMQRIDVQQNLRGGVGYITTIMRELNAADGDIGVATATRLQFRSMRWAYPTCADPTAGVGTTVILTLDAASAFGLRTPDAVLDSVLLFAESDVSKRSDDSWLVGEVTSVGTGVCTDGSTAITLAVEVTAASGGQAGAIANATSGAPVRGFQWEEISIFQGARGRWWMGQRTANNAGTWTSVQALAGPVSAGGLSLQYFDSTGVATGTLADIATIAVALRAESPSRIRTVGSADYARDSLLTRVALRNNPRF